MYPRNLRRSLSKTVFSKAFVQRLSSWLVLSTALTVGIQHASQAATETWNQQNAGTYGWDNGSNWVSSNFPNAIGDGANLNIDIFGNQLIQLNSVITIGTMTIGDTAGQSSYVVDANGGSLIFDNGGTPSLQKVGLGFDLINSDVTIEAGNTLTIQVDSGILMHVGNIQSGGAGTALEKTGDGLLILRGPATGSSTYTGTTTLSGGTTLVAPIGNDTATLGATGGANDTVVQAGATLAFGPDTLGSGAINNPAEQTTINGNGFRNNGALRGLMGANGTNWTGAIIMNSDSRIQNDVAGTLTLGSGTFTTNNFNLRVGGNGFISISGAVGGTGNITHYGISGFRLTNNSATVSGSIVSELGEIRADTSNTATGDNPYKNISSFTINNGLLQMAAGTTGAFTNLIDDDIAITLNAGRLRLESTVFNGTSTQAWNEGLGVVTIASGDAFIDFRDTSGSAARTINLTNLVRNPGTTLRFGGDGAAATTIGTTSQYRVLNATLDGNGDVPFVGGWAYTQGTATTQTEFVKYRDVTLLGSGYTALVNADYALDTAEGTWAVGNNIKITTGNRNITANTTINSLNMASTTGRTLSGNPGTTLIVESGGVITTGNTTHTITVPFLTAGASSNYELYLIGTNSSTITSDVTDNGINPVSVIKTGGGTVSFLTANSYTGTTYINEGQFRGVIGSKAIALGSGNLTFAGSAINQSTYENDGDFTRTLGSGAGQVQFLGGTGSGFSAYGAPIDINFGGAGGTVVWGSPFFNMGVFTLNGGNATHATTLINPIDFAGEQRYIRLDGGGSGTERGAIGLISGDLFNGGLVKRGGGTLLLEGAKSYENGTIVSQGQLWLRGAGRAGANVPGNDIQIAPDGYLRIESPTNIGSNQMIILQNIDNNTPAVVSFGAGYGTGSEIVFSSFGAGSNAPGMGGNNIFIANTGQTGQARRIAVTLSGNNDFQADVMGQIRTVAPTVEAWFGADSANGVFTGATLSPSGGTGVQTGTLVTGPAYRFGGHTNSGGVLTIANANVLTDAALGVATPVIVGHPDQTDRNYTDGTLYLPKAQSFSGQVTIGQGGILQVGENGALGTGSFDINLRSGELRLDVATASFGGQTGTQYSARNLDVRGGTGTIRTTTLSGGGFNTVQLNNVTIGDANRTLQVLSIGTNFTDLAINNLTLFNSANTLFLNVGNDNSFQAGVGILTVNGLILDQPTGAQSIQKQSGGVLVLTNAGNTYDGSTFVNQGRVVLTAVGAASTSAINMNTANDRRGDIEFRVNGTGPFAFSNPITTSGGNDGSTRVITVGANVAGSEDQVVQLPSLTIGHSGTFVANGSTNSAIFFDGANGYRTTITGGVALNRSIVIRTRGALTTFDGVVSGAVGNQFQKSEEGTLWLNGANTYLGPTSIYQGYLVLGNDSALGAATTEVTFAGSSNFAEILAAGTRTISRNFNNTATGGVQTIGGLDGTGAKLFSGTVNLSGRGLVLSSFVGGDTTFSGVISGAGAGGIQKQGNGTVILSNANTYSGGTTVTQGILVGNAQAAGSPFGSGAITMADGELQLIGRSAVSNTTAGILSSGGGARIAVDATAGFATTFTFASLTRTGAGSVTFVPTTGSLNTNEIFSFTSAPALVNTIVGPWAVATASGASNVADYVSLSGNNIVTATYGGTGDLDTASGPTQVFNAGATGGLLTANRSVFAFRTDANVNLAGFTLNVGDNATPANGSGIILNAGASLIDTVGGGKINIGNTVLNLYVDDSAVSTLGVPIDNTRDNSTNTLSTVITKFGAGTLVIDAVQQFEGNIELNRGTLRFGAANVLPFFSNLNGTSGSILIMSPGTTVDLNNFNQEIGNLEANNPSNSFQFSAGTLDLGTATLTVGREDSSRTFNGQILGGAGSRLVKVGAGTLTLTNINGNKANSLETLEVTRGTLNAWVNDNSWATPTTNTSAIPASTTILLRGGQFTALAIGDSTGNQQRIAIGNNIVHQGADSVFRTDRATGSGSNKLLTFGNLTLDVQRFLVNNGNGFVARIDGTTTLTNHARLQTDNSFVIAGAITDLGKGYTLNKIGGSDLSIGGDSSATWSGGMVITGGLVLFGTRGLDDIRSPGLTLVPLATANAGTGDIIVNQGSALRITAPSNILAGQEVRVYGSERGSTTRIDLLTDAPITSYGLRSLTDGSIALGLSEGLWTTPIDLARLGSGQWGVSAVSNTFYMPGTLGATVDNRYLFSGTNAGTLTITQSGTLNGTASVEIGKGNVFPGGNPAGSSASIRFYGDQTYTGNTTIFRNADAGSIGGLLELTGDSASPVFDVYGRLTLRGAGRVTNDAGVQVNSVILRPGGNLRLDYSMDVADSLITARLGESNLGLETQENKWDDNAPLILDAAGINLISSANRVNQETVGAITVKGGAGITLERSGSGQMVLSTSNITRDGQAVLTIRNTTAAELGSVNIQSQKLFSTNINGSPILGTLTNGILAPWMVSQSNLSFLSYDANVGFTNATFNKTGTGAGFFTGLTATDIGYYSTAGNATLSGTANVYALRILGQTAVTNLSGGQINIGSGGLITSSNVTLSSTNLYFGDGVTPVEGIIYSNDSTLLISSVVTANNLTRSGASTLQLTNAANAITGTIQSNGGLLYIDGNGARGTANQIILSADYLNNNNGSQMPDLRLRHNSATTTFTGLQVTVAENVPYTTIQAERYTGTSTGAEVQIDSLNILGTNGANGTLVRLFNSNSNAQVLGATTVGGSSPLGLNVNTATWRLAGSVTSAAPIVKTGDGVLRFDANNSNFTGGFTLNRGEWRVTADPTAGYNVGGTGDIELNFGTVRMAQNGASSVFDAANQDISVNGQVTFVTDRNGGASAATRTIGTNGSPSGNFFRTTNSPYIIFQAASFGDDILLESQLQINGSPTFRVDSTDLFLNGLVSGSGTFNKAGIWYLHFNNDAANTFTGGFNNFTGVTVIRADNATLGTGPVQVFAGTALSIGSPVQLGTTGLTKILTSGTALPIIGTRATVNFNQITAAVAAPGVVSGTGNGVLSIDAGQSLASDPLMATRNGGFFNLWNLGGGEGNGNLTTNILSPWGASGNEFRLGGGFSTLTLNPVTPGASQLSGATNKLIIGVADTVGGYGSLSFGANGNNTFGGGTLLNRGRNLDGGYRGHVLSIQGGNTGGILRTTLGTGQVDVFGEVRIEGSQGTAANAAGGLNSNTWVLHGGSRLRFDNSTAFTGTGTAGRWQDTAPIALFSSVIDMVGGNSTSAFNSETVGDISVAGGSEVVVRRQTQSAELIAGNLTRVGSGTLMLRHDTGLLGANATPVTTSGANVDRFIVANGLSLMNNNMVAPWIVSRTENQFLKYSATNGFQLITQGGAPANYIGTSATTIDGAVVTLNNGTEILSIDGTANVTLGANLDLYALRVSRDINTSADSVFKNIIIRSGGLLQSANTPTINPDLYFGAAGDGTGEAFISASNNTLQLNGRIFASQVTKSGTAFLSIRSDQSQFTGNWVINAGGIQFLTPNAQSTGEVILNGAHMADNDNVYQTSEVRYNFNSGTPDLFTWGGGKITVNDMGIIRSVATADRLDQIPAIDLKSTGGGAEGIVFFQSDAARHTIRTGTVTLYDNYMLSVDATSYGPGATSGVQLGAGNGAGGLNNQGLYDVRLSGDGVLTLGDNSASFTGVGRTFSVGDGTVRVLHNGAFGSSDITANLRSTGALEIAVSNFQPTANLIQEAGSIERWAVDDARGTGNYTLPNGVHLQVFTDITGNRTIDLSGGSIMGYLPQDFDQVAVIQTIRSGVTINLTADSFLGQVYPAGTSNGANHFMYDMGKLNTTTNLNPSDTGLRGSYLVIDGDITGNRTLTKLGQDVIKLAGNNTFTGLDIQGGIIQIGKNNALSTSVVVTTRGEGISGILDLNGYNQTIGGLNGPSGSINNSGFGFKTLTVNTAANTPSTYDGLINGSVILEKAGPSSLTLNSASGYLGGTIVSGGALRAIDGVGLPTIGNLNLNGGVFAPLTGVTFTRALGTGSGQVQLSGGNSGFSGSGSLTTINLPTATVWGSPTFNPSALVLNDSNATAGLVYASDIDLNADFGTVSRTIRVDSVTHAATFTGALNQSSFDAASLIKAGSGTLIIPLATGMNYTGNTTVSGGTLRLDGARSLGGAVTVGTGSTLSTQDGAIATLTLTGSGLTIGSGGLALDYNASLASFDTISAANLQLTANSTVALNNIGAGLLGVGSYDLANYTTSTLGGVFTFVGGAISMPVSPTLSYTLDTTSTALKLVVGNYSLAPGASLYFKGAVNGTWNSLGGGSSTNFVNAPAGVDAFTLPDATRDVYLSANTAANLATTLGADTSIKGLIFTGTGTSGTGGVSVSGNTLTLGVNGITVQSGAGVSTINSNLTLGGNQTWTNNSGNGNALNINSGSLAAGSNNLTLAGTDPINISSIINLASTISYTGESTGTLSGIVFGSGDLSVVATGAATVWGSLAFWPVNAGQLTVSGNALHSGTTTVNSGTLRLNNGLTSSSGLALADDTLVQATGTISVPVTTIGANNAGSIQAVGPLVLQNSSGAFNFAGLIDAQSNLVQIVAPVRSTLDFINLENGANISAGNGLRMPDGDGGSSFLPGLQKGLITLTGSATIGGDIQLGAVSGDAVDVVGLSGPDTLTFTGVIRGGISAPGVTIDLSNAINRLGFSPSFNPFTSSIQSNALLEADTNAAYGVGAYTTTNGFPQPKPNPPAADGSNYTQYLAYGYDQISGTGNNDTNGLITINPHAAGSFSWSASSTVAITGPSQSFTFYRTDGHNWANYTSSGNAGPLANRNGVYELRDGSLAGFANVTIASFSGLPALPGGQSWQVESTDKYIRLYIQGFLPMGSGSWKNGGADQLWTTNSAANNNWAGAQPSSVGQIATFDNTVTNYAGGVVNVDLAQTIGGLQLSDSGSGGYNFSGNTLTLTNANIAAGVVTYTDPTINANSGAHTIANNVAIGNGNASGANGLVVTTAASAKVTMSGNISSGFHVGDSLTKEGVGVLVLAGAANTYSGNTNVNGGVAEVSGSINGVVGYAANVNVNAGGTLTGTGTIGTTNLLNINGGTLSPGVTGLSELTAGVNQVGTLNAAGGVSIANGSTFKLDLQAPSTGLSDNGVNDKINVTGSITLAGTTTIVLTMTGGYTPANGDLFFIALNDGVDAVGGTFANFNVPDAGGFSWILTTTANADTGQFTGGNDIALMAVPEPNSLAMLVGSLSMALGLQRFRRRERRAQA